MEKVVDMGKDLEGILTNNTNNMRTYRVENATHPVANDIYEESSLDIVNVDNPTDRTICAPGEFTLGDIYTEEEIKYEHRTYENEDGSEAFSATFAVPNKKN